jgi:hypothetical protein
MFSIPFSVKAATVGAGAALLALTSAVGALAADKPAAANPSPTTASQPKPADKGDRAQHRLIAKAVYDSEADALGMTPEQLRDALRHGKSVEDLAKDRGMNKDQFIAKLLPTLKPRLQHLVDAHQITQAQADKVLDYIAKGHVPGWSHKHHKKAS